MEEAMHRSAQGIQAASQQHVQYAPDAETVRLRNTEHILNNVGLVFMFSSLACMVVALIRRESGWYSIPIMLLMFDLMTQMLL